MSTVREDTVSEDRLYYDDAYTTTFDATVVEASTDDGGKTRVVLESSYFYPTSGGQMHDTGRLGDGKVVDVLEEGDRVVHVVTGLKPPPSGARLEAEIDAGRRRDHRQQHTGQHVLSRVIEDRLGLATVSSRLGESGNTLDLAASGIAPDDLDAVEDEANAVIWEGRPVHVRYLSAAQVPTAELRKIPPREGRLRVIEVEGHDRSACGGTHVRNTAEIGLIAITKVERIKGGRRVHFLCGDRALRHRRRRDRLVSRLCHVLTTGDDEMEAAASSLSSEVKASHKRIAQLERELLRTEIDAWRSAAECLAKARLVVRTLPAELAKAAGDAAQALMRSEDVVALLMVDEGTRTQVLLGRGSGVALDCRVVLATALEAAGGRGGGQPHYARGSMPGSPGPDVVETVRRALT
jgi:alanyl-tRNA synthetase